MAGRVDII